MALTASIKKRVDTQTSQMTKACGSCSTPSDAKKAAAGLELLRAVMQRPAARGGLSPRTPHSSSVTDLISGSSRGHHYLPGASSSVVRHLGRLPISPASPWSAARGAGLSVPRRAAAIQVPVAAFAPLNLIPDFALVELPFELLQTLMDWLPTFAERTRLCAACKMMRALEWRRAPPLRPDEELSGWKLGDVGATAVAWAFAKPQVAPIGELCLGNNGIGDAGASAIAAVLQSGSTIRRLSLRDNEITDVGAQSLAVALSSNSALEELDLWSNFLTDVGKAALINASRCKIFLELEAPSSCVAEPMETMIHGRMPMLRSALFDWVSQVHTGGNAPMALDSAPDPQDTLFRTFQLADAYLVRCDVSRTKLQLIGVACTLAAAGLDTRAVRVEDDPELVAWLASVTDGACTPEQVQDAALDVQEVLGFKMYQPTAYTFLRRFLRRTGWTEESFSLANYLIELMAIDTVFLKFRPQAIAAAAAILCRQYLAQGIGVQQIPNWKSTLLKCAGVSLQKELAPCAAAMGKLHSHEHTHPSKFVNRKYELSRLHAVAKIVPSAPKECDCWVTYLLANDVP